VSEEKPVAMVVEDEWLLRLEVADALTESGWYVIELATGEQALSWLAKGGEARLLITDIRLSGSVLGWEVAVKFRDRFPDAVVVYCSANARDAERQVPDSFFFAKPIRMQAVMKACGTPIRN